VTHQQRLKLRRLRYDLWVILLCWRTDGFESFELFRRKFRKHAIKDFGMKDFGIKSECLYIWKADSLWRGKSFPVNHYGPPLGNPEECLREENYTFIRRNDITTEISFLQRNLIQTYYTERDRQTLLEDCLRT
jgi:hypothetical protein